MIRVELTQAAKYEELDDEIVVLAGCALGFMGQGQPPHVLMVDDGTQIATNGVQSDDILVKVDDRDPKTMTQQEFRKALQEAKSLDFERPAPADAEDSDAGSAEKPSAAAAEGAGADAAAPATHRRRSRSRRRKHHRLERREQRAPGQGEMHPGHHPPPHSSDPARGAYPHEQPPRGGVQLQPAPPHGHLPTAHEPPPVPHHMWPPPPAGHPHHPWAMPPPHPGYRPPHPMPPPHAAYPMPGVSPWHPQMPPADYGRAPPPRGPPSSSRDHHHSHHQYSGGSSAGGKHQKRDRQIQLEKNESGGASLVVERLPMSLNNMDSLSDYFSKFGAVVAIQVNHNRSEAIISFRKMEDAEESLKAAPFGDNSIGLRPYKTRAGQRGPHEAPFQDRASAAAAAADAAAAPPVAATAAEPTVEQEPEGQAVAAEGGSEVAEPEEGGAEQQQAEATAEAGDGESATTAAAPASESQSAPAAADPAAVGEAAAPADAAAAGESSAAPAAAAPAADADADGASTPAAAAAPAPAAAQQPESGKAPEGEDEAKGMSVEAPAGVSEEVAVAPSQDAAAPAAAPPALAANKGGPRNELEEKRTQLLEGLTKQLLLVMTKTRDPNLSEKAREQWQGMLVTVKEKIAKLTPAKAEPPPPPQQPPAAKPKPQTPTKPNHSAAGAPPAAASGGNNPGEKTVTFTNNGPARPASTMLRVSNLPLELQEEAKLRETLGESLESVMNWAPDNTTCILIFTDRKLAEAAIEKAQKDFGFVAEWPAKPPPPAPARTPPAWKERWMQNNRWSGSGVGKRKFGSPGLDPQDMGDVARALEFDAQSVGSTIAFESDIEEDFELPEAAQTPMVMEEEKPAEAAADAATDAAMESAEGIDPEVLAEAAVSGNA